MKSVLAGGTCTAAILAFSLAAYAQTTGQTPSGQSRPSSQSEQMGSAQQVTITGCVQREGDYRRAHGAGHGGAVGTGVGAGNEFVLINASHSSASSTTGTDTQAGTTPPSSTAGSATGTTGSSTGATGTTSGTATTAPGTAGGMPSTAGSPSATAGTAGAAGSAFELTGAGEGQVQQYVGKRVEIVGRIKSGPSAPGASGSTTGAASGTTTGSTAGSSTTGSTSGTTTGSSSVGERVSGATKGGSDIMGQDLNLPELEVVSVKESAGSCPAASGQNPR